ncbi:hypothetical protein H4W33_004144 [Kibdelosporangium phytohabitans]|nr:hypothetical protein [Kibdelosporangium phytohabitans]
MDRSPVTPDLDLAVGVGADVVRPRRSLGATTVGRHHEIRLAFAGVDERAGALLTGAAADRAQQQSRCALELVPQPPVGTLVDPVVGADHRLLDVDHAPNAVTFTIEQR